MKIHQAAILALSMLSILCAGGCLVPLGETAGSYLQQQGSQRNLYAVQQYQDEQYRDYMAEMALRRYTLER